MITIQQLKNYAKSPEKTSIKKQDVTFQLNNLEDFKSKVMAYMDKHRTVMGFTPEPISYPCIATIHHNHNLEVTYKLTQ